MRRLLFLIPLFLIGCINIPETETEERDILWDVTGVWSKESYSDGITVFEINFFDSLKTIRLIYTPNELDKEFNREVDLDIVYDISIKSIDDENKIVSFYLNKKGENFKETMRGNPIWTIRQHFIWDDSFTISLTTDKGKNYDLRYVRDY
tara:strand:+ start:269 stop:718 length:450 start_codon:yes stop_codon:yes gene_type:complete